MSQTILLSEADVIALTSIPRATLQRLVKTGGFARPIKLGRRVYWIAEEIDRWVTTRVEARDSELAPRHEAA